MTTGWMRRALLWRRLSLVWTPRSASAFLAALWDDLEAGDTVAQQMLAEALTGRRPNPTRGTITTTTGWGAPDDVLKAGPEFGTEYMRDGDAAVTDALRDPLPEVPDLLRQITVPEPSAYPLSSTADPPGLGPQLVATLVAAPHGPTAAGVTPVAA